MSDGQSYSSSSLNNRFVEGSLYGRVVGSRRIEGIRRLGVGERILRNILARGISQVRAASGGTVVLLRYQSLFALLRTRTRSGHISLLTESWMDGGRRSCVQASLTSTTFVLLALLFRSPLQFALKAIMLLQCFLIFPALVTLHEDAQFS